MAVYFVLDQIIAEKFMNRTEHRPLSIKIVIYISGTQTFPYLNS